MDNLEEKVIKIAAQTLKKDPQTITLESRFVDDLGADSLDRVEFMMDVETEFKCDIPDEDADKISTVKDAVEYIRKKIS